MNYEEKVYKKFGKINYTFKECIRKNKRTFIKIECNKCNHVELKEQFNLFTKNDIFCHNCNNRKKANKLDIKKEIFKIEEDFDVKILNHKKIDNEIFIYFKNNLKNSLN